MTEPKKTTTLNSDSSVEQTTTPLLTLPQLLWKTTSLSLIFVSIFLGITAVGVLIYGWTLFQRFLSTAELSHQDVRAIYEASLQSVPLSENGTTIFLILGTDTVSNKLAAPLTDTMMLASINHRTGAINLLPLPRDIWSEEYQTKINSLYAYGIERDPTNPTDFPTSVLSKLLGVPIHYTIVVSLEQVAELIDVVGGVSIDVPEGFTDSQFPREDIDIQGVVSDSELYETITFEPGLQQMNAKRALQYIRSRHSEGEVGTDTNRSLRQQLLLTSLSQQILNRSLITQPEKIGRVYLWYEKYFAETFPVEQALALGRLLLPQRETLTISPHNLSIYPDDPKGVIEHPPLSRAYQNQWVYRITDREAFRSEVRGALGLLGDSKTEDR